MPYAYLRVMFLKSYQKILALASNHVRACQNHTSCGEEEEDQKGQWQKSDAKERMCVNKM